MNRMLSNDSTQLPHHYFLSFKKMAKMAVIGVNLKLLFFLVFSLFQVENCYADDILGCGGFVKSHVSLDFSKIEIGL